MLPDPLPDLSPDPGRSAGARACRLLNIGHRHVLVRAAARRRAGAGPEIPSSIRPAEIAGRWGYASYHKPDDRARTEAAARNGCKQPYVIGLGQSGGVMMHLADTPSRRKCG